MIEYQSGELKNLLPAVFAEDAEVIALSFALKRTMADVLQAAARTGIYADLDGVPDQRQIVRNDGSPPRVRGKQRMEGHILQSGIQCAEKARNSEKCLEDKDVRGDKKRGAAAGVYAFREGRD